ncbi:hypothetical protein OROMI_005969 [Orobanche minor]
MHDLNRSMVQDSFSGISYYDENEVAAPVPLSENEIMEMECFIDMMDHLLACEATWHMGEALADTVYSCIYMWRLRSLVDYNLLYSFCGVTAATCRYAVKLDHEKDFLAKSYNADGDADFMIKLEELEDDICYKLKGCQEPYLEKLYDAALQRILFRKLFYLLLKAMRTPKGKGNDLAKAYIASCISALSAIRESEEFMYSTRPMEVLEPLEEQTTASGCKPIGVRSCAVKIVSWKKAVNHFEKLLGDLERILSYHIDGDLRGAIQIAVDFHRYQPNMVALSHLKLMLVQDQRLYGSEPMLSVILKSSLLPEDSKNHEIVKSEHVAQVGKYVMEMLQVLCEDIAIQRPYLEKTVVDWKCLCEELEDEYTLKFKKSSESSKKSSKKRDVKGQKILNYIGSFVLEQTTWLHLRLLTLGFESMLYTPSDYAMVYWCMSNCQYELYELLESKLRLENEVGKGKPEKKKEREDVDSVHPEAKLLSCYYYVSIGLVKVLDYLRTHRKLFLCSKEEQRFKKLIPFGFAYERFKIETNGIPASYLKGFTGFNTAYETAKEIEAHFVNDPFVSEELKKLKKVALRNNIALKTIAAFDSSDTREISLELVDHSHFASIFVKRGN